MAGLFFAIPSSSPSVLAVILATIAGTAAPLIYRLFFAPLSRLPRPRLNAITDLPLMYHEFKGDRTIWIDGLHTKFGPVVRVSPREVSFNDHEALKEIYGIKSDFSKSHFYDMFVYYNERNTFTSLDKPSHSAKKKLVADRYTKSYVVQDSVANQIRGHALQFLKQVSRSSQSGLDVYKWLHYYALDCITNHLYGVHGTQTLSKPDHRDLVYDLSGVKHRTRLYMIFYFGSLMAAIEHTRAFLRRIAGASSDFHVRGSRLNDYGKDSITGFRSDQLEKDSISTCAKLFKVTPSNENAIAAECMDHLVAGVDTTGDAMCILMWRISTPEYQHVQDRLYQELQSVEDHFDHTTETAPITILDKLPYLNAVVHEGLRWRAPVPMTLFRLVPPGGKLISGHMFPQGTTVGCQAYSLHRRPDVFPDPDRFDPDRWLTKDEEQLTRMKAYFWPFSSGGRMCLGHNIAMVEMKVLMAAVFRRYRTSVVDGTTEESMRMDDQLTSGVPFALSCMLSFDSR